jgi:hypothetical protein
MKAMTDKVIVTIVSLIVAVIALIIIWLFLSNSMPYINEGIQKFGCNLCKTILFDLPICGNC